MQNQEAPDQEQTTADRKAQSVQVAAQTNSDKCSNPEIIAVPPQVCLPQISLPGNLSLGMTSELFLPQPALINIQVPNQVSLSTAESSMPASTQQQSQSEVTTSDSIQSTPTFLDNKLSFGNNLNLDRQRIAAMGSISGATSVDPFTYVPASPGFNIRGPPSLGTTTPSIQVPVISNALSTPTLGDSSIRINVSQPVLTPPTFSIKVDVPVLMNLPHVSSADDTETIGMGQQLSLAGGSSKESKANTQQLVNSETAFSLTSPSITNSSSQHTTSNHPGTAEFNSSDLGAGLSVKINTNGMPSGQGSAGQMFTMTNGQNNDNNMQPLACELQEKDTELNLKDLDSSDEDMSAGPSGGCTGEPQQFKKSTDYQRIDERRLLGTGSSNMPTALSRGDSQQSGHTSGSETNDMVHPLMKFKKTKSQLPKFDQGTFGNDFNENIPHQFQINSYSQAQRKIEDMYQDLQKVVKIAKGYREDFLTLQNFIKDHFKSADILFKNSGFLAHQNPGDGDPEANKGSYSTGQAKMMQVLQSCFQETPCVAMAFASPLCRRVIDPVTQQERVDIMPQLDFAKEFKGAVQGIEETGNAINVQIVPATLEKFTNCLMQKPIGLHFTGHGVENNAAMIGQDTYLMSNQGNCLVFEKEDASAHFVSQQKLKDLFEMHVASLKFVFIATCHSEFAGDIFHWAGVDHVICVKKGNTILDPAAIFFARKFYQTLFMEKYTICDSFKMAKNCLKMHPDYSIQQEADKLIMILNTDDIKPQESTQKSTLPARQQFKIETTPILDKKPNVKKEHKCCILGPFQKRDHELIESKPTYPFEVAKISEFVGRQREMQEIIASVLENRFTTVLGVPGIGKTTITKSIGFHLSERKTFHDGIMFFTMRGKDQTTALIQMLFLFLKKHDPATKSLKQNNPTHLGGQSSQSMVEKNRLLKQQSALNVSSQSQIVVAQSSNALIAIDPSTQVSLQGSKLPQFGGSTIVNTVGVTGVVQQPGSEYKQDYYEMEQQIHNYLDVKQTLIIIDNLEDVLREDEESLRRFLTELLEKLPGVSILTTSRQKVQNLGEITECLYELKQLTNNFSIRLLEKKCLRPFNNEEIKELFEVPAPMQQAFNTPFSGQNDKQGNKLKPSDKQALKIEDHHLCTLLGGHPHAISLVAPFLQNNRRLADLYKMLLNMVASEDFMKDMHTLDPTQSLKVSMDTSTLHMRNTQPEALNLFCLLGMLPGGVCEMELPVLWGCDQWLVLTESLRRASLIVERVEQNTSLYGGKNMRTFRLLPFMNKYAESLLSTFDRIRFHNQCCLWLLTKVMDIFIQIKTEESRGVINFADLLMVIETNVWASIYRICDFSRDRLATKKLQEEESQQIHQQALTGYSSAQDEYEAVLLRGNLSIMQDYSDVSGDDQASNAAKSSSLNTSSNRKEHSSQHPSREAPPVDISKISNPSQMSISFNSFGKLGNRANIGSGLSNLGAPRKISIEDTDNMQKASDSSLNDRLSSQLDGLITTDPYQDNQEILEKPLHEDADSESDCSENEDEKFLSKRQDFENNDKDKRRVSFALNHSSITGGRQVKSNKLKSLKPKSGPNSIASFRDKNSTSPFNATQSQIEPNSHNSDSNTMTRHNFGITMGKLSNLDTQGDGQNYEQMSALGSIDQSERRHSSDSMSDDEQQPMKRLVKSSTQKYLDFKTDNFSFDGKDEPKRQSSTTDNLVDKFYQLGRNNHDNDLSFMSEKLVKGPHAKNKQILKTDEDQLNNDSSKDTGNAYDISFNIQNEDAAKKSKNTKSGSLNNDNSKTFSSDPLDQTFNADVDTSEQQSTVSKIPKPKFKHFAIIERALTQGNLQQPQRFFKQKFGGQQQKKPVKGSMALKSQLEVIQERYEMSNDSLLIVTYISVLVLNHLYGDAIRAIEIVNSSEPTDPLLQANLRKLNALALMKSETTRSHQFQANVQQAFRQFEEAMAMFEKIGRKSNSDNEGNLGRAVCLYGMSQIMFKNPFNFKSDNMDEDQCFRHVLNLLEQATEIYKRREHFSGAAQCLQSLAMTKKKLQQNYINVNNEAKEVRKQIKKRPVQALVSGMVIKAPYSFIYRHDGMEISLLIEIVDSQQIQTPTNGQLTSNKRRIPTIMPISNRLNHRTVQSNRINDNRDNRESIDSKTTQAKKISLGSNLKNSNTTKKTLSPATTKMKEENSAKVKIQNGPSEKQFTRKSQKVYASQTRQNNQFSIQSTSNASKISGQESQQQKASGKTLHILSLQSGTSTDDSLQNSLNNQQKAPGLNLKQVNILSDTTHSENEFPINSARKSKESKTNNIQGNLKKQSARQKKQVELVEPLADIAETTQKTKDVIERRQRANLDVLKAKQKFEETKRRTQQQNASPRPSIKKKRPAQNMNFNNDTTNEKESKQLDTRKSDQLRISLESSSNNTKLQEQMPKNITEETKDDIFSFAKESITDTNTEVNADDITFEMMDNDNERQYEQKEMDEDDEEEEKLSENSRLSTIQQYSGIKPRSRANVLGNVTLNAVTAPVPDSAPIHRPIQMQQSSPMQPQSAFDETSSVYESVTSENVCNSSFTTNDERSRRPPPTGNSLIPFSSQLQRPSQTNSSSTQALAPALQGRRPTNRKYAHVKSKVASYLATDKNQESNNSTSAQSLSTTQQVQENASNNIQHHLPHHQEQQRQDTPVRLSNNDQQNMIMQEQLGNSPFSMAEELFAMHPHQQNQQQQMVSDTSSQLSGYQHSMQSMSSSSQFQQQQQMPQQQFQQLFPPSQIPRLSISGNNSTSQQQQVSTPAKKKK